MENVTAQPDIKSRFVKIIFMKSYNSVSFGCFPRRRGLVANFSNVKHSNSYVSNCFTFAWRAVYISDQICSALIGLSNRTGNTKIVSSLLHVPSPQ